MPSRWLSLVIVLFWIGTLGWFGYRELWPYWATQEAPPFVIDLADEATPNNEVLWYVMRETGRGAPEEIGLARTFLTYSNSDDTFELTSELVDVRLQVMKMLTVRVPKMTNRYRVTRSGELRGVDAEGELNAMSLSAEASFSAKVQGDVMVRSARIKLPFSAATEPKLENVPAPRGSVLNPLHPVSRIKGLKPGRRWTMPVVNPLADVAEPVVNAALNQVKLLEKPVNIQLPENPKELYAEVLTEIAKIKFENEDQDCYVIEYRGQDREVAGRTYVRVSDGLVIRQEATTMSEKFYLERVAAKDKVRARSGHQSFQPKKKKS